MLTILKAITLINLLPCKYSQKIKTGIFFKRHFLVSKYIFQENYRLVMYDIDIKYALYFIVVCVVVLEIIGKMTCLIDSK